MKIQPCLSKEEEKKFLSRHYYYEAYLFNYSYNKIVKEFKVYDRLTLELEKDPSKMQNKKFINIKRKYGFEGSIAIEDFALHARNLIEFYYKFSNKREKDNAIAVDFLEDHLKDTEKWKNFIDDEIKFLDNLDVIQKTNKQVSHLTYARQTVYVNNKGWVSVLIYHNLLSITLKFLSNIKEYYQTDELRNLYSDIKNIKLLI